MMYSSGGRHLYNEGRHAAEKEWRDALPGIRAQAIREDRARLADAVGHMDGVEVHGWYVGYAVDRDAVVALLQAEP